jgi:hypothetical protein
LFESIFASVPLVDATAEKTTKAYDPDDVGMHVDDDEEDIDDDADDANGGGGGDGDAAACGDGGVTLPVDFFATWVPQYLDRVFDVLSSLADGGYNSVLVGAITLASVIYCPLAVAANTHAHALHSFLLFVLSLQGGGCFQRMCAVLFAQMSAPLHAKMAEKLFKYATTNMLSGAACAVGDMCAAAANADSPLLLSLFVPFIRRTLDAEVAHYAVAVAADAEKQKEKQKEREASGGARAASKRKRSIGGTNDSAGNVGNGGSGGGGGDDGPLRPQKGMETTIDWYLSLLSSCVFRAGTALLEHEADLLAIVDATLFLPSKAINEASGTLLANLLRGLSDTYTTAARRLVVQLLS